MTEAAKLTVMTAAAEDPDFPAESYRVRIGDEIEWVDINMVYGRDDSTKGNSNPKSHHGNQNQQPSSNRWSGNLKSKAPIIGLPNRVDHSGYLDHSARRPYNGRIFPKGGGDRRPDASASDPGSPKVSCFGKIRSVEDGDVGGREWCWASLASLFPSGGGEREAAVAEASATSGNIRPSISPVPMEAPVGLGGMKRFESRRRAASWGGDAEVEAEIERHVPWSGPLDRERAWGRP